MLFPISERQRQRAVALLTDPDLIESEPAGSRKFALAVLKLRRKQQNAAHITFRHDPPHFPTQGGAA